MSAQPPFFAEPASASRLAAVRESVWLRIGALQTSMNDRDRALEAFEKVLHVNPANIHAMTQVGAVLAKKERYTQAVGYLRRAIAAESTCGEAWAVLAHCYVMTDDLPKAYQAYQNALNHLQDPSDPNLWYGIGLLYDRYGSLDNALEAFLAVLRIAPNFERAIEVCFCIGIIYKEQRKLDDAMSYFNKVSLAPNPPPPLTRADGWYQIGHVNELKRDINKALEMYKLALQENPSHAKTLQNLGWLEHSHKENSREAIRLLQMSLEADNNDGQTWYLLGRVFMALREFRQAYDAYQQAVYRDGRNATFWCSIGVLYYQMNQYRDAMDAYARAIRLNPQVSEVWYDLGTLYESCGQTHDAIDAYRRAADLAPESSQITERLAVLQNSLSQGNAAHPQQQSQPMTSQPPLQQPHPQLPPPQAHLPQHQPPHGMQQQHLPPSHQDQGRQPPTPQQQQASQQVQQSPVTGQTQAQHPQSLQNHSLQPIGLRQAPQGMQQQMPMLLQHPQQQQSHQSQVPHSVGLQPLTRHIMHNALQQPPGSMQHGPQGPMRPNSNPPSTQIRHLGERPSPLTRGALPQLSMPGQQSQGQQASQGLGTQAAASQRSDQTDPRIQLPSQQQQQGAHGMQSHQNQLPQPLSQVAQSIGHQSGPLSHGLPQLPSMQSQQDGASVQHGQPGGQVSGKPEDSRPGDVASNNPQNQLPQMRIGHQDSGKDGAPGQLDHIPPLQRPDGPGGSAQHGFGPPSRPGQMGPGSHMAPIPSLAPLSAPHVGDNKQVGPNQDGQGALPSSSSLANQRLPSPGVVGDPNNSSLKSSLPPLQQQGDQKIPDHSRALPSVSATMQNGRLGIGGQSIGNQHGKMDQSQISAPGSSVQDGGQKDAAMIDPSKSDGRGRSQGPNGGPLLPPADSMGAGPGNGHEDAKLLHSVAMSSQGMGSSPKRALLGPQGCSSGLPGSSASPVPVLTIPRSVPAPRQNKDNNDLRLGSLGASSLTKFGRSQSNSVGKSSIPSSLPSPLPPLRKGGGLSSVTSSGIMSSPHLNNPTVPPLKSGGSGMGSSNSGMETLPSPSSLPVLSALSGNGPDMSSEDNRGIGHVDKVPGLKSPHGDGDKKLGNGPTGMDGPSGSQEKPSRPFGIPRSVPISSLSGGETKGSISPGVSRDGGLQGSSSNKREVSPGVDTDKTYKRPRVNEPLGNQGDDDGGRLGRRRSEENGDNSGRHPEDVRMSDGMGRDDGGRDATKNGDGDGRMGTPLAVDPGRTRSLTSRGSGPQLPSLPSNAPLPSFRSSRERMNMGSGKPNSFGGSDSRMKSPVINLPSRSPGQLHLRSQPIGPLKTQSFQIPKSQRPMNVGRGRDGSQPGSLGGRSFSRGLSPRSGGSHDSDDKGLVRSDSKNSSGMGAGDGGRRDSNQGDKDHGSSDPKVTEAAS